MTSVDPVTHPVLLDLDLGGLQLVPGGLHLLLRAGRARRAHRVTLGVVVPENRADGPDVDTAVSLPYTDIAKQQACIRGASKMFIIIHLLSKVGAIPQM